MTSTFAAQLRTIAANSTNELDLRARRDAHAESLIFERSVAVKQDWETIYHICLEGFQELCMLDSRLREFGQNLYSPQAKDQDREQLSKTQNDALGVVLERFLVLLGSKILLRPGARAIEWLVRRFRVHVYNTGAFLATFLPYHETPIFRNALSIIPANKIVSEWKFLGPYHKDAANVPRHAIVYTATHNDAFFSLFNQYTLRACQESASHPQLLRFWGGVVVEAVTARLQQVKNGRKEVQRQRTEDALLKILPLLIEGFDIGDCPELTVACFTISLVLAGNADLEDHVIDTLMKVIAPFIVNDDGNAMSALACVAILVTKKDDKRVPKGVLDIFSKTTDLARDFLVLHEQVPLAPLCEALVRSALSGLKQKNLEQRLRLLEKAMNIARELFEPAIQTVLLAIVLKLLLPKDNSQSPEPPIQIRLVRWLQGLNDSPSISSSLASAASLAGVSNSDVEGLLEGTIQSPPRSDPPDSTAMEVDVPNDGSLSEFDAAETMLVSLPPQSTELSFLTLRRSSLFDQLARAFTFCHKSEALIARFEDLTLWRQQTENPSDLHTSFLLRLALGAYSATDRHGALQLLAKTLKKRSRDHTLLLIPYVTVLLCDHSQAIRRAAVACILAIHECVSNEENEDLGNADSIYDALSLKNIKRISSGQAHKLLNQVYVPYMEECVLDPSQIRKLLKAAFGISEQTTMPTMPNATDIELKKTQKHALFELFTECALSCPLLKVRTVLIELFEGVHKVGTASVGKTLSPILRNWASLSKTDAENAASAEGLSLILVDEVMVQLIAAQDKGAVEEVLAILVDGQLLPRDAFIATLFNRIAAMWKDIRQDSQIAASLRLFDMSFSDQSAHSAGSRHVLHSITFSTEVLAAILDHSISGLAQMQIEAPPRKYRRTSHGRESIPKDMAVELEAVEARLTFALELVENSKPESHPQLLAGLFEVLVVLRRLTDRNGSESPYLLNLCLSSILSIVKVAQQARRPIIDMPSIRADLVTDCVRLSENPQVQSTALLLCASLASLAPDRILHTIMPIFTFMGKSILSKDDERSIYATNRAIDEIIPPLVASLKKQDATNLIRSTSSLLSSFVTAYDHIPQHRRLAFYQRLLGRLGVDDFAFAIIALLASRKYEDEDTFVFCADLIGNTLASTQLATFRKIVELTIDAFATSPHNAEPLLDIASATPAEKREQVVFVLLEVAAKLLASRSLKGQVKRLAKSDEAERGSFWTEFKSSISHILSMLKSEKTHHSNLIPATRACLNALLELPSLADLLDIMPKLLSEIAEVEEYRDLQPLALRVLAAQLQHSTPSKDGKTPAAAISFLPTLETIIRNTEDESFRHAAIQCLDRIVETYGRKSPDEAIAAVSTLVDDGGHGVESGDQRTQIMSLLCLATSMEVFKEGGLPIVLGAMPKILPLLDSTAGKPELHNACYSVLSSFISHVPFMVSDENVTEILEKSYRSCVTPQDLESRTEARIDTLGLVARKIALPTITASLSQVFEGNHSSAIETANTMNARAIMELMDMFSQAIEHNNKATVAKSADQISGVILQILDIRRLGLMNNSSESTSLRLTDEDLQAIESKLHALGVVFIYKLNDSAFRPIFESWVDWAAVETPALSASADGDDDDSQNRLAMSARLTSFFSFARHFFDTLKSIVTSYASYTLPLINKVLRSATLTTNNSTDLAPSNEKQEPQQPQQPLDLSNPTHLTLYKTTLSLLTTIATHDSDGFFTTPSHFHPLSSLLVNQFHLLSKHSFRPTFTDTIITPLVAVASAVQDIPAHHHTLNHFLCNLRRADSSAVRLASIKSHLALTESEDVGDEWVQNVVLGQASGGVMDDDDDDNDGDNHRDKRAVVSTVGGSGETMIYVNEMLEDDDEDVELSVRRWVRIVRERVGEDVFEM